MMMTEPYEEQACLYVLGLLPEPELSAFEQAMCNDPELASFVAAANNATLALARSLPAQELPAALKLRLMSSVQKHHKSQIITPTFWKRHSYLPWAAAACLVGGVAWNNSNTYRTTLAGRDGQVAQLENDIKAKEQQLANQITQSTTQRAALQSEIDSLTADTALATSQRTELLKQITELEQRDVLAQERIAVLGSLLKDQPSAVAVSLWNQEKQTGLLVVENFPLLDPGKDYQLWIIDPTIATPVSAGIFKVDGKGKMRLKFAPGAAIQNAAKFAVTEEVEGGVASPTMDKMVVIGGS